MTDILVNCNFPDERVMIWPMNLLAAIDKNLTMQGLPGDFEASLAYVLNRLTERERNVLLLRFAGRETYEHIGKQYGVTRQRIRQVEGKALRKMNHHMMKRFLRYGVMGVIRQEDVRAQGIRDAQNENANIPLENLDLSVRAHNCLMRAGHRTAADILAMDNEQLMKIRNLGAKSAQEIVLKLESLGFNCEHLGGEKVVARDA